jgi:hypothetical protein
MQRVVAKPGFYTTHFTGRSHRPPHHTPRPPCHQLDAVAEGLTFDWCQKRGLALDDIRPVHVAPSGSPIPP